MVDATEAFACWRSTCRRLGTRISARSLKMGLRYTAAPAGSQSNERSGPCSRSGSSSARSRTRTRSCCEGSARISQLDHLVAELLPDGAARVAYTVATSAEDSVGD